MKSAKVISNNIDKEYFFEEGCYIWELSNSDEDENLSIARARLSPNTETKPHFLKGTIERYVILEGQGEVFLDDTPSVNSITQTVSSGDIVIIPQGCSQWVRNIGDNDLVFLVICTPRFLVENYCESTNNS